MLFLNANPTQSRNNLLIGERISPAKSFNTTRLTSFVSSFGESFGTN